MKRSLGDMEEMSSVAINDWFVMQQTVSRPGRQERGQLSRFESCFLSRFPPYFHDLRSCMSHLWDVLFPSQQAALAIQCGTFRHVWGPMKGCWRFSVPHIVSFLMRMWVEADPASSGAKSQTRKRAADDNGEVRRTRQHTTQDTGPQPVPP